MLPESEEQEHNDLGLELSLSLRPWTSKAKDENLVQIPQLPPLPPPQIPPPLPQQQQLFQIQYLDLLHSPQQQQPPFQMQQYVNLSPLPPPPPPASPNPNPSLPMPVSRNLNSSSRPRSRAKARPKSNGERSQNIPPPFPWATDRRATVYSLEFLKSNHITSISGEVQCKRCERQYEIEYDLIGKFSEIANFLLDNDHIMHKRAPSNLMNPTLPRCKYCEQENSASPVIAGKKKSINWLFLLLGKMIGCCTHVQLKYFCKHTLKHRTGAKDRLTYSTYFALCDQLHPGGLFNR